MTARLDALRDRLDERLLVTNLANVHYLTGFESSNAGLLVEPGGEATLYTDFRYILDAERVPGVRVELAKRSLMSDLAERLEGRIGFEADVLPYRQFEALGSGGLELVPTYGVVEALRAVKDDGEIDRIRRAARAADHAFHALTAETWVGHTERELAWRLRHLVHAHGADHLSFDTAILSGANGAKPHSPSGRPARRAEDARRRRLGRPPRGLLLRLHAHRRHRPAPAELKRAYDVCLEAQLAAVERSARA